ncbi:hypothetical protein D3C76_1153860 [compost metagenome]
MLGRELLTVFLTLHQYLYLTIFENGVVNFFAFLDTRVCSEFGDYFGGVEHIITEYAVEKWHDKGVLCCLFGCDHG